MQVESFLRDSARRFPSKTALVTGTGRHTYADLDGQSERLAHAFRAAGVRRGDRVAVFLENSTEAAVSIFAALKAGGVFVVVNPSTKADKLRYILNDCGVSALVTQQKLASIHAEIEAAVPSLRLVVECEDLPGSGARPRAGRQSWAAIQSGPDPGIPVRSDAIDLDLATIIYTSGSTGHPKGVMMTHLNVGTAATSITTYLENSNDDVVLSVLPLSFDYGLYQLLMAFKVGGTLILERSFAFPAAIVQKMREERITGLPLLPTMSALLLQFEAWSGEHLPHLRYVTNTGQALPTEHIRRIRERFPGARVYSMYGLTECKRVSYLPPELIDQYPSSVGVPIPNTEVFVVDDAGREVGPGVVGQLVVRGSHVMKGYWGKPEETARMLRPGKLPGEQWLWTGDLFKRDAKGLLYFVGRQDDIIKSRGEKVSPKEVEDVLYRLPGVQDAAVMGVPDEVLGQAVKAVIVRSPGSAITAQDVLRHCSSHLETIMVPKIVDFCEALPTTSSGKVSRRELASDGSVS